MFSLKNKTALVTGAGSGIGAAIAEVLAEAGARVFATDADEKAAAATADRINAAGHTARSLRLDITREADIAAAVAAAGPLDVLVNNAGVGCVGTILQTTPSEFDRLMGVNVRGTFLVTQAFLPAMLAAGRGSVINLASVAGIVAVRERFAYTTTKFAIVGLTKALALDHSHTGLRFNAICPGRVETPWVQKRLAEYSDPAAARREMASTQLAGRMATPGEIAAAALYLAADESVMVTGSTLMIDSGWTAGK
ncbi:MAG TPA: SDR family NAD(P)-dependent oxidoreductase [Opitutaceae bacterium]|nr:SDR family NAD(P)-dependent oxidoreductase [Opitutaceae bacterium]